MNQPQTPQFMFPFPWMQPPPQQEISAEPPVRVQVALAFLNHLTQKARKQAAISDVGIEVVDAPEILPIERKAQAQALDLLITYFKGALIPSEWEQKEMEEPAIPACVIACPQCHGEGRFGNIVCPNCSGKGKVLVRAQQ